jgi:hypothetical protein
MLRMLMLLGTQLCKLLHSSTAVTTALSDLISKGLKSHVFDADN